MRMRQAGRSLAVIVALALSGCAGAGSGPNGGAELGGDAGAPWPTDGDRLLLRMQNYSGMLPPGGRAAAIPPFSLYADGSAVVSSPGSPHLRRLALGAAAMAQLREQTESAGLFDGPTERGTPAPDAPVTVFTVLAGEGHRLVTVVGDDESTRTLSEHLAAHASAQGGAPYAPDAVAVIATSGAGGVRRSWPLERLSSGTPVDGSFCRVVRGADARAVSRLLGDAAPDVAWTSGGYDYAVALRPLLPDERGCADLT